MRNLRNSFFILLFLTGCSNGDRIMEGSFRNIKDNSETIIKKVGENQYEVIAAFDPRLHFTVTRKENILTGSFQSKSVVIEYNSTFDTITNKASGNIVFICKRINK